MCTCDRCHRDDERATGLLAAAREGVADDVIENRVRDGLKRINEDVGSMRKEKSKSKCTFGMIHRDSSPLPPSPLPKTGRV